MKKYLLIFLISSFVSANAQNSLKAFADSAAAAYLEDKAGAIIIGVDNGSGRQLFFYGTSDKNENQKPDENSIFEIGNITETFTCILFADRTIKGLMQIDDPLGKYMPADVPAPVYQPLICKPSETRKETSYGIREEDGMKVQFTPYTCRPDTTYKPQQFLLCFLATHTSGLPDRPVNFFYKDKNNPYADYTKEDFYDFLRAYHPDRPIGFQYKKSETGIALLAQAISHRMKMNFESVLVGNLLDTMQLKDTRITLNENQNQRLLQGHNIKRVKTTNWSCDFFAPAVGLHSSASDMMTFLSLNIDQKKNYFTNLLDYTHNPRLQTGKDLNELEIGLGWKISSLNNDERRIVWQSGRTGGFASYIGFVETSHKGVFILSSVSKDVNEIGTGILKLITNDKNPTEGNKN